MVIRVTSQDVQIGQRIEPALLPHAEGDIKELLSSVAEGLSDDDLERATDHGREQPQWHF